MTRVLLVMDGTGTGGAETSMAAIAPLLRTYGIEVEVAYFHERSGARERFLAGGIRLQRVVLARSRLGTIWRLKRLIKELQPDLVHTMVFEADITGRSAAFFARVPVVSSIISDIYSEDFIGAALSYRKVRLGQILDALTAQLVDSFHAVSLHTASSVPPRLGARRKPVRVIYRSRDLTSFTELPADERSAVRESLGLTADERLVLVVARHAHAKGIDTAIKAVRHWLAASPSTRLLIVGNFGEVTVELEKLVRSLELDDYVSMVGHRNDIADLIGASDVLLCPSRWEGFPGAALEAKLCGRPIVASDIAPFRELAQVTDHSEFFLFRTNDPGDLASKIVEALMIDSRTSSAQLAAWKNRFGLEEGAAQFADFYHSMIELRG